MLKPTKTKLKLFILIFTVTTLLASNLGSPITASPLFPEYNSPDLIQLDEPNERGVINYTGAVFVGTSPADFPGYSYSIDRFSSRVGTIAGYYDRNGFENIYSGPSNGGIMPLNGDYWGEWRDQDYDLFWDNPLIASRETVDGRTTRGTFDDYWIQWNNSGPDPYIVNGWTEHPWGDAMSDYMKSSQSAYKNNDGDLRIHINTEINGKQTCTDIETAGNSSDDAIYGIRLFYEARGYEVVDCFFQMTDNSVAGGFSYEDLKAQIDQGNPVLINKEYDVRAANVAYGYSGLKIFYRDDTPDLEYMNTTTWAGLYNDPIESVIVVNIRQTSTVPRLTQPYAKTADDTPRFRWTAVKDAEAYKLEVFQNGNTTPIHTETVQSDTCGSTFCTISTIALTPGAYSWQVSASIGSTWMETSSQATFSVISPKPILIAPKGATDAVNPTFSWKPLSEAAQYQYRVYEGTKTTPKLTKVVERSACTSAVCSVTPIVTFLPAGDYRWQVQALINGEWKPWSAKATFNTGFYSPFTSNASGWSPKLGKWTISGGYYQTDGMTNKFCSVAQKTIYSNFTYTAKVKTTGCVNCSHGIIFLGKPTTLTTSGYWANGFIFVVTNSGYYLIAYLKNGATKVIRGWEASRLIKTDWNILKVEHNTEAGKTRFFINGSEVHNDYLTQFSSGQVGIGYYQNDQKSKMYIDYANLETKASRSTGGVEEFIVEPPLETNGTIDPGYFDPTE